jgi:cell division protease FtsH
MPESQSPQKYPIPKNWIINVILIIAFVALYYSLTQKPVTEPAFDIPYSEFKQLLNDGALASVTLKGNRAEGTLLQATGIGPQKEMSRYFKTRIPGSRSTAYRSKSISARSRGWFMADTA